MLISDWSSDVCSSDLELIIDLKGQGWLALVTRRILHRIDGSLLCPLVLRLAPLQLHLVYSHSFSPHSMIMFYPPRRRRSIEMKPVRCFAERSVDNKPQVELHRD